MEWTIADTAVMIVMAVSIVLSMMRGILAEAASLVSWVLAVMAGKIFAPVLADRWLSAVNPRELAVGVGFLLVFVIVKILTSWLAALLTRGASAVGLGAVNRILGGVFGAMKAYLLICVIVLVALMTDLPQTAAWRGSMTLPIFEQSLRLAVPYLPSFMQQHLPREDGSV